MPNAAKSVGDRLRSFSTTVMTASPLPISFQRRPGGGEFPGRRDSAGRLGVGADRRSGAALGLGPDLDRADARLGHRALQVDMQQSIVEVGADHLDAVDQDEAALELARRDAAMQIDAILVVLLLAAN